MHKKSSLAWHSGLGNSCCVHSTDLIQGGQMWAGSINTNFWVSPTTLAGWAHCSQWHYTSCVWIRFGTLYLCIHWVLFCFYQIRTRRKLIFLPCRSGSLLLISPFLKIFSLILIFFNHYCGGVSPPASSCISLVKLIWLGAVGPNVPGLTSSPAFLQIKSHSYLLSLSKYQIHSFHFQNIRSTVSRDFLFFSFL
jgi:hypothetical protein